MSLLDLVSAADVTEFKALLKRLSKGEPPPPRHELTAHDIEAAIAAAGGPAPG